MPTEKAPIGRYEKDPDAQRTIAIDWSAEFGAHDGSPADPIASASWVVPSGISQLGESLAGYVHKIKIGGGTAGQEYRVTSRVVTQSGERDDRSIRVVVVEL